MPVFPYLGSLLQITPSRDYVEVIPSVTTAAPTEQSHCKLEEVLSDSCSEDYLYGAKLISLHLQLFLPLEKDQ